MNEQEVKKLYQALLSKGYSTQDLGDEQRFLHKMSDAGNRKQLYDWVSSRGNFRIGDFNAYEARLTGGAQQEQPSTSGTQDFTMKESELEGKQEKREAQKPQQPTVNIPSVADMMEEHKKRTAMPPVFQSEVGLDEEGNRVTKPKVENVHVPGTPSPQVSPVYRDFMGNEYDATDPNVQNEAESQVHTQQINLAKANRVQVADLSQIIDDALADAKGQSVEQYVKLAKEEPFMSTMMITAGAADPTDMQAQLRGAVHRSENIPTEEAFALSKRIKDLEAAQRAMRDAKRIINEADHNAKSGTFGKWLESSFAGGAVRGFGQKLFDVDTWDMGFSDAQDATALMSALNAFDKGEPLTDSQQALLDAKAVELATNAYFGSYVGRGYKAGNVTAESVPFMIEMCLNPASGTGHAAQNVMARYAIKRFGKKVVKDNAKKYLATKVATRVAGDIAGSSVMAATTGSVGVTADAINRMNGDVQYETNDEGLSVFAGHTEGDDFGEAFGKAFASRTIENYSEMMGEYFAPVLGWAGKGVRKGLGKVGLEGVNDFIENVAASDVARVVGDFEKNAKWNGVFGEYAEEVAGGIMNAIVVGDQTLDADPETGVFNLDNNIDTFLGVSLMGGFMSGIKTAGYRTPKYRARQDMMAKDDAAASVFGNQDTWGEIRNTIAVGDDADAKRKLAEVLGNPDFTPEQRAAALEYAKAVQAYRGMLKGEEKRREEQDPTQTDLETSFDNGYSLESNQEMNDAKNMLDYQRQRIGEFATDDMLNQLDADPVGALNAIRVNEAWTDEEKQTATDYVNAKATYDGMIQHVQDDIESQINASNSLIDGRVHPDDGMIHPATMKTNDRKVYVIGGNLAMNDDGTMVDRENSDESIIVRDAETGSIEFADPRDVLSTDETIDAAQEKQIAQEAIRQQYAQEAANKIDGVLPFNEGDTYQVVDGDGEQHTITVAPIPVDDNGVPAPIPEGEVLVSIDGTEPITVPSEQVQQMADNANLARLAEFEQGKAAQREAEAEAEREANRPVYNINDEITLQTDEGTVRGSITADANEDGLIEVYTERPIGGKKINLYNRDELDAMVVQHNGVAQEPVAEVEPQPTEQPTGESVEAADDAMPMIGEGDEAEPDFMNTTPERAHSYIYNEAGLSRDEANQFVEANKKAADKALDKAKNTKPKMGTSIAKYRKEQTEYQQKVDAAQKVADYWKKVKDAQQLVLSAEQEERAKQNEAVHEQAVIEEQARQAEELRKREEQAALGTNNVAPAIREKWEAAPKVEGARNEIVLANGERVQGRYLLVESGAATPSHNPRQEFAKNEGFPLDENGQSVNDRDYERDKDAQGTTRHIASVYDQRALQTPVVVTNDGIVLSGNGRTMAGELAAQDGTDGAYIEHLKKYGQQFGFTPEQVEGMQHPRVVFVPDEAMPYTAETFAKFNQQEMKGQSKTEQAVKLGKVVGDDTFARIISSINGYNTLGDFYADPAATTKAINELREAGAISQAQYAEMFDGDGISAQGREILENMLIGKAFESNPDAVREITAFKSIRQSIITALAEISNNIMLGKEYSLESELAQAIDLVYQARQNGYKAGDAVSGFARQGNLFQFDEGVTVADFTNATVLMLADVLNDNRTTLLKKTLTLYNKAAEDSASGQLDIFSGDVRSKDDILNEVRQLLQYGTEAEQQAAIATATEERVAAAQEDGATGAVSDEREAAVEDLAAQEDTPEETALRARIEELTDEETTEDGENGVIYHRPILIDGTHRVEQVDAPDEKGNYNGSYYLYDGQQFAGIPEVVAYIDGQAVSTSVAQAESEVNTSPTPAQKEAGNYKKGHVRIDGFDVTIENPRGSERSGTDASGKEWRQVMNNTYGYIRGTEGVDGDHIDVFLSDNPESGEVFVVDQVNKDGSFDEHKVMYGFPDIESARKAYLSNYEEGWHGLGAITPVSKEEFKKWIESSHRKTKPFAEYSSVKTLGDTQLGEGVEATEQKRSFIDAIKDLYSKGKEYASKLYSMTFFDVAKTPVFMKALGLTGDKFTIRYGVLSRHIGKDVEHTLPVEVWEKLPDALQSPFAITRYYEDEQKQKQKGYRLYTAIQLPNGSFVIVSAEVKNAGRDIEVNAINTVFGRNALSDVHDELIYTAENITPEQQALLNGNNPHQYPAGREQGGISEDKGSEISANEQEKEEKSAGQPTSYQLIPTEYTTKRGKKLEMQLVKFDKELTKEQRRAANNLAKELKGWWSKDDGGFLMRDSESAEQLASAVLEESGETLEDKQPLSLHDMATATEQAEASVAKPEEVAEEPQQTAQEQPKRLVSDERMEELKARLRKKMGGQMNMGVDPEILAIGAELAVGHIERGLTKFADYAKTMIEDLGDAIRPYLKAFYNAVRDMPEAEEYASQMDSYDDVRTFDLLTIVGEATERATPTVFEKAEEIAKEQDVDEQAEAAKEKITEQRNDGRKVQSEGVALDGTPLRALTEADLDSRDAKFYHQGKRVFIFAVMRSGEQVSATQFSNPNLDKIYLTSGQSVKPEELMVADDTQEPMSNDDVQKILDIAQKGKKKQQSKKKSVSLQQEPDLFSSFGDDATNVESLNDNSNGHARTDAVRSEGLPANGNQQGEHTERRSQASGQEGERAERGREVRGNGSLQQGLHDGLRPSDQLASTPSAKPQGARQPLERPNNPKNTHNNHAERGTDYAPKSVDARIDANIKAIELMQQLIESGEQATPEQMAVLRQFSGWGGLGKAFNPDGYSGGYRPDGIPARLRALLGEEAYEQANMSRNSAYYTPATVIDTMWDIARAMGFTGGNVLEGSAGIGNIIGLMPADLSERSSIQAVEIDQTTGNILKLLYPDAQVQVQGFEATDVPNGSVDLAITNVPFVTGLRVNDTTGDKDLSRKFKDIHDFCIAKNIRKLREGGIGIFITSSGTLDNSARLREWMVQEGGVDVVGAFRMHNETFGGTGATSDIIVVRKRVNGKKSPYAIDVLSTTGERSAEYDTGDTKRVKGEDVPVVKHLSMDYNAYFVEHPEMMGGEMHFGFEMGETFRPTSKALYPVKGKNQAEMLKGWAESFADKDWGAVPVADETGTAADAVYEELGEGVKEGSMVVSNGQLCVAQRGKAVPLAVNANKVKGHTKVECFEAYQGIKQALAELLQYQTEHDDDAGLQPLLKALNRAYDQFVKTYGHLHRNTSISFLKNDVDFPNVLALEKFSERGDVKTGKRIQEFGKTDIFSRRVVEKEKAPEPKNVQDGIIASIYVHGRVDIPWITEQLNKGVAAESQHTEQSVKEDIINAGLGFEDPVTRQMEVSYEYLSGNVREKLAQAQANNTNGQYDANIKALEAVIPMNIPAHLIDFNLGSSWIDPKLYEEYIKERTDIDVSLTSVGGTWMMRTPYFVGEQKNRAMGIVSEMLHKTIMGTQLIEAAMQNKTITVSETRKKWDGSTETVTDKEATQACANKIDEIRQDFRDWARARMQSDPALSEQIERTYNEVFNNYVPRTIPDEFVPAHFGGAATVVDGRPFALRPHQGKAVVRATMQPLLLAHEVGTGKTYTLITTAMEMRRLGTARKPMIVVQNATVGQFVESAKKLYPNAKVLTLEEKDHTSEGRRNFYAKIKYNDWDMIVVPQSVFERIPDSEERQMAFVQDKIEEKLMALELMRDADPNSLVVKQAEREIEKLEDELADLSGAISDKRKERDKKKEAVTRQNAEVRALEMLDRQTDDVENFDDMGIDAILVDEAHEYKHLGFATAMQRGVKGIDPSYSKKAQGVYLKAQAVLEKNNGRNVVFATGTPISNTAAEIWTFMRYLMPADTMKEYGIYYFDDFVRNFGNLQQMLEFTTSGKFKENNRFAGYVNLPELVRIWSSVADTVLTKDVEEQRIKEGGETKIPDLEGGKAQDIYLPQTRALRSVMKYVKKQLEDYEKMSGKEKKENSHIPLTMYGIAKAAAVDTRLVLSDAVDEPQSKTNEAVRQTLRSLKETASYSGTVAIFADNYQNKHSGFNIYEDIRSKLIAAGVPAEQIVVMKSGMSVKKKLEIFDRVNRGEVRVIMGSTFTLGTGVNIQERLHTLIHLDAPNRPMDYTQRNGRILRQGNLHREMGKPVRVLRFGVEDSLDVTAYQRLKTKGAIADSIMNGKQMMANSMESRNLEEEEDVFGDTVAQLSGSEYAMLKNQAEKEVRKYEAKKKQWEADQTYCHHEIPRLVKEIEAIKTRMERDRSRLEVLASASLQHSEPTITVGAQTFASVEGMADYIKDFNKRIKEVEIDLRENPSMKSQQRQLTVTVNGIEFVITTELSIETKQEQGTLFSAVHRKMTYDCEALDLHDVPVRQSLLREALEDIVEDVISGKDFRDDIEACERVLAKDERSLKQVREREGKPFEYEEELSKAHARLDEYSEAMKKELEEKEKKYKEMDSDVEEAAGITEAEEDDEEDGEDEDVRFRDGETESDEENDVRFREVSDAETIDMLESQPTMKVYRSMVLIDGKLYPPMSSKEADGKQLRQPSELGKWEESEEAPEKAVKRNGKWYFPLRKDNGKMLYAAYNPYIHTSTTMLNDQFSEAQDRDNLVVVEMEVPVSELTSEYQAEKAKDTTGAKQWKAGVIQGQLSGTREVILTRWAKPVRIVPVEEVADHIANMLAGQVETMPTNVVTPQVREALEARGVQFVKTNNQGRIAEGENAGKTWASVYGKKHDATREREGDGTERMTYEESLASSRRAGYTKKQHDAFIARQERRMRDGARELISRLKLDGRVTVKEDASGLKGRKARAKGWFDVKTGKIVIVLSNHSGLNDVLKTILHEGVGHYGLRKMFGSRFDQFLDNVFQHAETDIRAQIVELAKQHKWDFREATEEYLSMLAEDTDFERANGTGWWSKIKTWFLNMLRELGLPSYGGSAISDNELRYILWRSYNNLRAPLYMNNVFAEAEDISKQMELGLTKYDKERARLQKTGYTDTGVYATKAAERFRDGDPVDERDKAIVRDNYERMTQSGMYQFREAVQDSMLSLRRLMEDIDKAEGGSGRIEDISAFENAYLSENAMSSASHEQQRMYGKLLFNPLLDEVHRLVKEGATRDEVTRYMMAKHGLERNRVMAEQAFARYQKEHQYGQKTLEDFRRDYAGLTGLTGFDDVADAEAEALNMVEQFESSHDVTDLWDLTNACTKATLEKVYKGGLMSKEAYESVRDMYEYYVPLRGFDETTSDEVYGYLNHDAPAYASVMKSARGRNSVADDPLAVIANMADAGIMQANRNLMKQKFLKFVMNHPSDLVSVSDMWLRYDDVNDEWIAVTADIDDNDSPDDVLHKTEAFEAKMEQLAASDPDHYKRGSDARNIPYRTLNGTLNEHQVHVKMGGKDYVLTINGNPRAAQALNGLTNPDTDVNGAVGAFLKAGQYINRQMSAFYTTRNPEFVLSNFLRDLMYANSTMWVREKGNYALKFNLNFVRVNPGMIYRLIQKHNAGKLDMSDEIEKAFYDFMVNGGETGYTNVRDVEKQKKLIKKYLKEENALLANGTTAWEIVGEKLDEINRSVENCARFAAFLTSRQYGRSIERSIYDAKEVSVNFNKKGAGSKFVGTKGQTLLGNTGAFVSGTGRSWFVFWNASIQGITNYLRLHKHHTAKAIAYDMALFALGAVIAGYGGGDDDDYWNLPEWIRRNNICIKIPGTHSFIKIPLGQEMRSIYGMGELASSILSGRERKNGEEVAMDIISQLSQTLPLDLMEGGRDVMNGKEFAWSTVAPSYAKPFIENAENRNWMGLPIYEDSPWNQNDPEWTKAGKRTNKWLVNFSRWCNEMSGGDGVSRGWANWNPSKVEHLLEGVFGGYSTTVNKLVKDYEMVTGTQPFDWGNVLMASRVVANADERAEAKRINSEYYRYYEEYKDTKHDLNGYKSEARRGILESAEKVNFLYNSPEYGRYIIFDNYVKVVNKLNNMLDNIEDKERREQIEVTLMEIKQQAVEAIRQYDDNINNKK